MSAPLTGAPAVSEPTLSVTLAEQVRDALPERLAQLLHLALPLSVQFAVFGWWRSAGWALAISAFGSWGLAGRWLARPAGEHDRWRGLVRAARVLAGTVASALPVLFLLELFLRAVGKAPIS